MKYWGWSICKIFKYKYLVDGGYIGFKFINVVIVRVVEFDSF